jgi:hypothetical protein
VIICNTPAGSQLHIASIMDRQLLYHVLSNISGGPDDSSQTSHN